MGRTHQADPPFKTFAQNQVERRQVWTADTPTGGKAACLRAAARRRQANLELKNPFSNSQMAKLLLV